MNNDIADRLETLQTPMQMKTNHSSSRNLALLRPGESAVIFGYTDEAADDQRLAEMGITLGANVKLVKCAPLGDPIQLMVRGYHLSISKRIAQAILVK